MKTTFKTNSTFYNAVDWVKTHGYDFWEQFEPTVRGKAVEYVEMVRDGVSKSEALKKIRN